MDLSTLQNEALIHLQNLIRINTTNPPGNEIEAVRYLAGVLKKEDISYQIFEPSPGRASLVARLKGNGSQKPLLLTSHLDVVPAEAAFWKIPPFSGELEEGCLWGRGAVDMKQMTVMELMTLLRAKREGLTLKRDLILAAVADEEAGCRWGSQWLVENHPEVIQAEFALNEVGGFSLSLDGHVFYPIGVAEKGLCWFKVTSKGDPGHGSMPHENQAILKLAKATQQLGEHTCPFHSHEVAEKFVKGLAGPLPWPKSWIVRGLAHPRLQRLICKYLLRDPKKTASFEALFHDTLSPTVVKAGEKINVIPSKAELLVDGRLLPGHTLERFVDEVRKILGPDFELEVQAGWDPPPPSPQNDFFKLLSRVVKRHDPQAIPVPYLIPGFTDTAWYSRLGIQCYGFAPVKLPEGMSFAEMFHGHNERIPVEGFLFGVQVLWDVVREAAS